MANEVRLTVAADTKSAERNIGSFESRLKTFSGRAASAGKAMTIFGAAGSAAMGLFVRSAIEQRRVEQTLAAVVEATGQSFANQRQRILDTTAALQAKTNFGDEEQIRALTKMIPILGSTDKALQALPVVMDAAVTAGLGLESVAGTMSKALGGLVHMSESLGIKFETTDTFAERLAKVMSRVEGTAERNADEFIQLAGAMGDTSQAIGAQLLPVIAPLLEKMLSMLVTVQQLDSATLNWTIK